MSLIFILFLILPFAGAIGTANNITRNLVINMASWLALIQFLLLFLAISYKNQSIFISGIFIISLFASSQIISAGFIAPYYLFVPIQQQIIPTAIGNPVTYLYLDTATSKFFNKMIFFAKTHGFKPGDDILAFSNMPGIVFALGGKSPIIPWYTNFSKSIIANEWILKQAELQRIKKAFILQNASSVAGFPNLAHLGISFPTDYILCGQAVWPLTGEWVKLWKPKNFS